MDFFLPINIFIDSGTRAGFANTDPHWLKHLLLMAGDVETNPGPCHSQKTNRNKRSITFFASKGKKASDTTNLQNSLQGNEIAGGNLSGDSPEEVEIRSIQEPRQQVRILQQPLVSSPSTATVPFQDVKLTPSIPKMKHISEKKLMPSK